MSEPIDRIFFIPVEQPQICEFVMLAVFPPSRVLHLHGLVKVLVASFGRVVPFIKIEYKLYALRAFLGSKLNSISSQWIGFY